MLHLELGHLQLANHCISELGFAFYLSNLLLAFVLSNKGIGLVRKLGLALGYGAWPFEPVREGSTYLLQPSVLVPSLLQNEVACQESLLPFVLTKKETNLQCYRGPFFSESPLL